MTDVYRKPSYNELVAQIESLVAERDALVAEHDKLARELESQSLSDVALSFWHENARSNEERIEALVAERDALRADAERYRWLRQIANRIHERAEHVPHVSVYFPRVPRSLNGWVNDAPQFADLDAAIDAALREGNADAARREQSK